MSSAWSAVKVRSVDTGSVGGVGGVHGEQEQMNATVGAAVPVVDDDNEGDDFSATISSQEPASVSMSKSSAHSTRPSMTRRMLVPFARSSTLKSGSLQDLKSSLSSAMTSTKQSRQQQHQQQQQQAPNDVEPPVAASQCQQVGAAAAGAAVPPRDKVERQRSGSSRSGRNPFRSSKSMLLLAQNQHIPQASTQLDCFISRQQADFLNYASQYNTSAAAAAAAAATGSANQSGSDNCWMQDNSLTGPASGQFVGHEQHQQLCTTSGSNQSLAATHLLHQNSHAIPMKIKGQLQDNIHHHHHHQQHQSSGSQQLLHQGSSLPATTGGSSSSGCNALSKCAKSE